MSRRATLFAGIPAEQPALFHRVRFVVGDPAGILEIERPGASPYRLFIVRDIEVARAKQKVSADRVAAPQEFAPSTGLSPDRATATAQSIAEALRRESVDTVRVDRTLPYIYAHHLQLAGLSLVYDDQLGVADRRSKDERELQWLAEAQAMTEQAMEMACGTIAQAQANRDGILIVDGEPLTSERVKSKIARFLIERNYGVHHGSIVATTPDSADCHESGSGPLRTGQPVIVDIFPRNEATRYHGDCTRTVVHGQVSDETQKMHRAVVAAKAAATAAVKLGNNGQQVHEAAINVLLAHGYASSRGTISDAPTIQHGTGHGIGLEIHEPILLDIGGPELVTNEVVTVEPGLYGRLTGGVRVEDMVVCTTAGPRNLNRLHEGLDWKV